MRTEEGAARTLQAFLRGKGLQPAAQFFRLLPPGRRKTAGEPQIAERPSAQSARPRAGRFVGALARAPQFARAWGLSQACADLGR